MVRTEVCTPAYYTKNVVPCVPDIPMCLSIELQKFMVSHNINALLWPWKRSVNSEIIPNLFVREAQTLMSHLDVSSSPTHDND